MPMFDFLCEKCGHVEKDVIIRGQAPRPDHCNYEMTRLPAVTSFVVNGYNAKNRYSKEGA